MNNYLVIVLFFGVFASGLLFYSIPSALKHNLKLVLTFSGAYLFVMALTHLMPEVYSSTPPFNTGVYIFIGFFLQILLEFFTQGIEHGHTHKHSAPGIPIGLMVGLCIHSFLEGMPINQIQDYKIQQSLALGILVHHAPVAIALMGLLNNSKLNQSKSLLCLSLFAIMAPAGSITTDVLQSSGIAIDQLLFKKLMAVVIGIFLHISTTILFESEQNHRLNLSKMIAVAAGAILAFII
ncbi:MAG: hypothetical protein RIQ89_1965 [Bacteroidota bacterium]|jgi:zinc and cadmium transporter